MAFGDRAFEKAVKTTSDGRMLFRPNGKLGRGYIIPSDEAYERLRRVYSYRLMFTCVFPVLFVSFVSDYIRLFTDNFGLSFAISVCVLLIVLAVFEFVWLRIQFRRQNLQRADEKS